MRLKEVRIIIIREARTREFFLKVAMPVNKLELPSHKWNINGMMLI